MKYWDASALVPLLVIEPTSAELRRLLREDGHITTWHWTRTEVVAALERRARQQEHSRTQRRQTIGEFNSFADTWDEVAEIETIRSTAHAMLARHALKAADAGQLSSALIVQAQLNEPLSFVCLDNRLSDAAALEGLQVMPKLPERQL